MSQAKTTDQGTHSILELTISKGGKLGIEFRATSSPYFVINVSAEAHGLYGVQPGDLLMSVKKDSDSGWTEADSLEWPALVDILKHRPALARFKRFKIQSPAEKSPVTKSPASDRVNPAVPATSALPGSSPLDLQPALFYHPPTMRSDVSPKSAQPTTNPFSRVSVSPRAESLGAASPPMVHPPPTSPASVAPLYSPVSVSTPTGRRLSTSEPAPTNITIVYSTEGPLGLEFEEMDFPFRVGGVRPGSISEEKGVRKGDSLITVNGKDAKNMTWDDVRAELSNRPATVVFLRDPSNANQSEKSIWDVAAGFVRGASSPDPMEDVRRERDELRQIVSSVGAEDLVALRQIANHYEALRASTTQLEAQIEKLEKARESTASLVEEERAKNIKLVEVIEEIEKSQSVIIERFEKEIHEKERLISEMKSSRSNANSSVSPETLTKLETIEEALKSAEAKLELMEKDNTRLRKENTDLGVMVQQCLEKIQRDLSDKPHWVDRRVVCSAIGTLLRDLEQIDESSASAVDAHMSARQKLGDVLGMTYEERTAVGLLSIPANLDTNQKDQDRGASISEDFVTFLQRESQV